MPGTGVPGMRIKACKRWMYGIAIQRFLICSSLTTGTLALAGEGTVQAVVCDLVEAIRMQPRVNQGFGTHTAATVNAG